MIGFQYRNTPECLIHSKGLTPVMGFNRTHIVLYCHTQILTLQSLTTETGPEWTNCIIDKIFKNVEIVKFITTALKSVLKLVKLQSLVAKCCKMQKIQVCKIRKFCILLYYARKTDTTIEKTVSIFRPKYKSIQNLQTLQGHIFHILQHFATKLCGFTKFRMLFNAVVMNFTISKFLKILSIMQSVH